ncbi:MAG: dTDP-4-dehydrorhamnose reductase [Thalassobium sp.]|nr:MAG: dTDP-4-dehydrorhamnose reductase [Thalassobium sp.]
MTPVNVLLTGAGGQLGQCLQASCPDWVRLRACDHQALDICDDNALRQACDGQQLVINCAAFTAVDQAEIQAEKAYRVNAQAVAVLAEICRQQGARLLHLSTDYVFSGCGDTPLTSEAETGPLNIYGQSKLAGEQQAASILKDDLLVIRSAWLYSHYGHNFLRTMLKLMQAGRDLQVVNDQYGSPTSTAELADVIWQSARLLYNGQLQGIYHWAGSGVASWYEFSGEIQRLALSLGLLTQAVRITPLSSVAYAANNPAILAQRPAFSALDPAALNARLQRQPVCWRASLQRSLESL